MDFNSNDEYLKAYPPNFGPKIQRPSKEKLCDLKAYGLPPKDPQENVETKPVEVPELVCLDDELECVDVQEPIQVDAEKALQEPIQVDAEKALQEPIQVDAEKALQEPIQVDAEKALQEPIQVDAEKADNYGDVLLEEQEEILILGEDLTPEIDEPMPQMADMASLRDEEMVIDDGDGGALETMLSLEAIEESVLGNEPLGEVEDKGLHSAVESMREKAKEVETKEPDTSAKDFTTGHSEAEKTVVAEGVTEEAAMEDEMFEEPGLKEVIKSTRVFTEFERHVTDVDTVEGNAMETEALNFVEDEQPAIEIQVVESTFITAETPDQIEFVESALRTLEEASENADAIGHIEIKEPVTLEVTEKTTIKTTSLTKEKVDLDVGTEDPTMALEIIEKTTIKAKAICQDEEEPRFTVKFTESTSTGITGFDEELGTCSEAEVDRIVDSIMNDIAGIEADMEGEGEDAGLEASIESNTQHQKVTPTYERPVGIECEVLTCQDHVGSSEGHA